MAGPPKAEFAPLLPHGFHDIRPDGLRQLCVDRFPGSLSRGAIMDGLERLMGDLNACGLRMDLWVDGSFLTQKFNPEDVDLAARVEEADWRAADLRQRSVIRWVNTTDLKPAYRCDAYAFVEHAPGGPLTRGEWEWDRAYWLRQFGFSRRDEPKGVAVIRLPFVIP